MTTPENGPDASSGAPADDADATSARIAALVASFDERSKMVADAEAAAAAAAAAETSPDTAATTDTEAATEAEAMDSGPADELAMDTEAAIEAERSELDAEAGPDAAAATDAEVPMDAVAAAATEAEAPTDAEAASDAEAAAAESSRQGGGAEAAADAQVSADSEASTEPSPEDGGAEAAAEAEATELDAEAATEAAGAGEAATDAEAASAAEPVEPDAGASGPAAVVAEDPAAATSEHPALDLDLPAPPGAPDAPADSESDESAAFASHLPDLTEDEALHCALEALLLVVDSPAEVEMLADALGEPVKRIRAALKTMAAQYQEQNRGIDLRDAGGGWRFYTRDKYAPYVEKLLHDGQRAKLTRAALESLAVIAYRQPVTRARVAAVRGVNVDGVIRTLLARGLIEETGTDKDTGGILYRTTELFLERLGLSSLEDLPPIAPLLPEVDAIDDV